MDKILRTLICEGQVSLTVIEGTGLVQNAINVHKTEGPASQILGGMLIGCAYLASLLKSERGSVSITVKAENSDGAVSVSSDAALNVRGYADGSCTRTLAGGSLTVVREDGYSTMPFVGSCKIEKDDISDILELYFGQSEQIPTAVNITVEIGEDGSCQYAGGVIMQLLPDAQEENIGLAADKFYKHKEEAPRQPAEDIFNTYFKGVCSSEVTTLFPAYRCNCSRDKIRGVLASVGKSELLNICKERGNVSVHCHYCNKDYVFDEAEILKTF